MAKFEDMKMPEPKKSEEEELDLFAEEKEESPEAPALGEFSDDELIEELKSRGFDVEMEDEQPMEEEMPAEEESEFPM